MLHSTSGARHFDTKSDGVDVISTKRLIIDNANANVQVSPSSIAKRQAVKWNGMAAEIVQATQRQKIEFRFRSSVHLLALYEQGARNNGDTFVQGLSRSHLRDSSAN